MKPTTYEELITELYDDGYIDSDDSDISEYELTLSDYLNEEHFNEGIQFIEAMYKIEIENNQDFTELLKSCRIYYINGILHSIECIKPLKFPHKKVKQLRKTLNKIYKLVNGDIYNVVNTSLVNYFIYNIIEHKFHFLDEFEEEKEHTIANIERIKKHYKNRIVNSFLVQILCLQPEKEEN